MYVYIYIYIYTLARSMSNMNAPIHFTRLWPLTPLDQKGSR